MTGYRPLDELVAVVAFLRPDWRHNDISHALLHDHRPPTQWVGSAIGAALDPGAKHPAAMRSWSDWKHTPQPPALAEVLSLQDARDALSGDAAHRKADEARAMLRGDDPA